MAQTDCFLTSCTCSEVQQLLLAFMAQVFTGSYGKGVQVGHGSIEATLHHIAQHLILAGYPDPCKSHGAKELDLPFTCLPKTYEDCDPVPQSELTLPVSVSQNML